jgi:hypothetical protein
MSKIYMRSENSQHLLHSWNYIYKRIVCIVVRVVLGSGLTAEASSDGFYIDPSPPVFDKNVMTRIYIDVTQGEFTPVKYQASNDTIKAYWYCFDEDSLIKVIITVVSLLY